MGEYIHNLRSTLCLNLWSLLSYEIRKYALADMFIQNCIFGSYRSYSNTLFLSLSLSLSLVVCVKSDVLNYEHDESNA